MEKEEKARNQRPENWDDFWKSIGIMQGCIEFLLRNTREKKIAWSIEGIVSDLNRAVTFRGTLPDGRYAIIEQTIVCTHFWNSIKIYDASGEIENTCIPDWEHGKEFWLLISMVRQQILMNQQSTDWKKAAKGGAI